MLGHRNKYLNEDLFQDIFLVVNCLLNAFSICVGEGNVFSLKVMVVFLDCVLLASPCIVFQRVCVLCW